MNEYLNGLKKGTLGVQSYLNSFSNLKPTSNISSNPSAISPTPTSIATPVKTSTMTTPAAQSYVNTLTSDPAKMAANRASLVTTSNGSLQDVNGQVVPVSKTTTSPIPTTSVNTSTTDPKNSYINYITGTGYFDPQKADVYRQQAEDSAKSLADIQSQVEKKQYQSGVDQNRELDTGQRAQSANNQAASLVGRRSNQDLAVLALQQSAAARTAAVYSDTYKAYIDAGKTGYEAETAAQKAVQDQKNKEKDQALEAQKANSYTLSPGESRYENGKLVASGGPKPLTAAQEAKQIADQDKENQSQQTASQALGIINGLINGDRYKSISGALQTGSIPFLGDRAAVGEYDQLQGLLKLGVRSLINGQGSVSDYEGKILGQAASSLSRLTDEDQFKQALQKVRGVLKTNNGQTTTVSVTNPDTGETITTDLSGPEIYHLVSEGNSVEYK